MSQGLEVFATVKKMVFCDLHKRCEKAQTPMAALEGVIRQQHDIIDDITPYTQA